MLSAFNGEGVEYLVVGTYALGLFGAPLDDVTEQELTSTGLVLQIGVEPRRIDVLTSITGVEFADVAWLEQGREAS